MSLHLIIPGWRAHVWVDGFRAALPDLPIHAPGDPKRDVDYAFVWSPPPGELAGFPNLKVIFSMGAGVDHVFKDPDLPDVPVVRVVDDNLTMRMGEWVILHVLLHHRQFRAYDRLQRAGKWREIDQPAASQVRVGIMGIGAIGSHCAGCLQTIGFDVAGWSASRKALVGVDSFAGDDELDAFLGRTDVLVNLLPLTPRTQGLIDSSLLARLAPDGALGGPVFINGGRGGSQVEADLVNALQDGVLKGASLDVFETEPLPENSPLWTLGNVFITPHVAAVSDPASICAYVVNQIARYERGDGLENIVDRERRY